ncbi:hypothetical protein [Reyranella sp.]|uniref:hypothetical protein n=1 Tax=Reyranella sp. TaxID=1929291 RepID=UPI0012244F4B|nr:hypothetical protein [Reyranella sp.]TAJ83885.1 MAG: hypothetical protein EPO50_20090 [Reyranella sp.]
MPFKLDIFAPDRIVVGVARGDISATDLAAFVKEMIDAGVLHYRKIIDITSATSSMGQEELSAIAERLRSAPVLKPRGPLAIVADHKRGELARLFMSMTSDKRPVEVFRSIHEARRWLLESKLPF